MGIKTKVVKRNKLGLFERVYLFTILKGMRITLGHFLRNMLNTKNLIITEYPEQQPHDITPRYRGEHRLIKHKDGSPRCVACFMCATYCPSGCIFITAKERTDGVAEKMPATFTIDLLECVFCGYCVEACPHDAIAMDTGIYTVTYDHREAFIKDIDDLLATPSLLERGGLVGAAKLREKKRTRVESKMDSTSQGVESKTHSTKGVESKIDSIPMSPNPAHNAPQGGAHV